MFLIVIICNNQLKFRHRTVITTTKIKFPYDDTMLSMIIIESYLFYMYILHSFRQNNAVRFDYIAANRYIII